MLARRCLALACVAAAVALAALAWPLVVLVWPLAHLTLALARLTLALRGAGARLRGEVATPPPAWPYAAPVRCCTGWLSPDLVQAVLRAHEARLQAGEERWH